MKLGIEASKLFLIVTLLLPLSLFPQDGNWPIVYNSQKARGIIELYDKGFVIVGSTVRPNSPDFDYGIIKKTDINGQQLWQKYVGAVLPPGLTIIDEISPTSDGGYILVGFTRILNGAGNTFAMKLNSCFEKEWSRIFYSGEGNQASSGIWQIESGNYLMEIDNWGDDINKRIWVFKLSPSGNIIWQKSFADDWEPGPHSAEKSNDFNPDHNGNFIITGEYYKAQPGTDTNQLWLRPMFIKIDTAGNEVWHLIYGLDDFYIGETRQSDADQNGNLYSTGINASFGVPGEPPVLYKVNGGGNMNWYLNLNYESDSIKLGRADDVSVMNDTILFVYGGWGDIHDSGMIYVFKADSAGNLIDRKFLNHNGYYLGSSDITLDNKYVLVLYYSVGAESGYFDTHLFKLNAMLEYDTLYNGEITYDSLCDHQIISDTIELDTTTVNLEHLAGTMQYMNVYPNPASDKVRVEVNIVKWKKRQLKVTDLFGKEVYYSEILPGRANHEIDVKGWPEGLYVFRLYENGELVQVEKVLIVR